MTGPRISIAVLVSAGRNPVSGASRACRGDAVALGLARRLAGRGHMRVLLAGAAPDAALADYLSLGAQTIEVLDVAEGGDVVHPLSAALAEADLVITGTRTEVGAGSGLLPYALAQALKRPIVPNVLDVTLDGGNAVIRQFLPKGLRRRISASLPAILTVHPLAPVELKYAYARRVSGRIERLSADGVTQGGLEPPGWTIEHGKPPPPRLKAAEKKSGHARLQSAIVSDAKSGFVAKEGTCVDKAQVVLSFLREHRLVDF